MASLETTLKSEQDTSLNQQNISATRSGLRQPRSFQPVPTVSRLHQRAPAANTDPSEAKL
jgi:hypothetical protein